MESGAQNLDDQTSETEKRVRESVGLWITYAKLEEAYPRSTIMLMGPSAPCDFLVIDGQGRRIIAVEVKASAKSSKGNRGLTKAQRKFGILLESNECWKAELKRYVIYGEPGKDAHSEEVAWKTIQSS